MGPTAVFVLVQIDNGTNWNRLKVIQNIPEPHTRKVGNKEIWRKEFYWALHTYFGKYYSRSTKYSTYMYNKS